MLRGEQNRPGRAEAWRVELPWRRPPVKSATPLQAHKHQMHTKSTHADCDGPMAASSREGRYC